MRLWIISQTDNDDYDTYDCAVVAAETEQEARLTSPSHYKWIDGKWRYQRTDGSEIVEEYRTTWTTPDKVKVELIGEAVEGTQQGIILASFNAG
jgi:hypothetical protein